MRRQNVEVLHEKWMVKKGIGPIELDPRFLDLRKEHRDEIRESLGNHGWIHTMPLVLAESDDPSISGQVLDGRHRVITVNDMLRLGIKFDWQGIPVKLEHIENESQLMLRRAEYEATTGIQKERSTSKRWMEYNVTTVIKSKAEEGLAENKILDYLHANGFTNAAIAREITEQVLNTLQEKDLKRRKKQGAQRLIEQNMREKLAGVADPHSWGIPKDHALLGNEDPAITTYRREIKYECEECGHINTPLILIGVIGELQKVEVARAVAQK